MENNKIIKKGLVVVVIFLFISLACAPSINANVGKSDVDKSQENDIIPVELEYQRIIELAKTVNLHKFLFDIDAVVDTLGEISTTLEENDGLRAYIEMQSDEDCGCENDNTTDWNFPFLCVLLVPLLILGLDLYLWNGLGFSIVLYCV